LAQPGFRSHAQLSARLYNRPQAAPNTVIGDALGAKPDDGRDMKHPLSHDVVLEGIDRRREKEHLVRER
jgi:hypothetical protein